MSYDSQESSTESGAPIELYHISGSDDFYYTSGPLPIVYRNKTYEPVPIKRTAPTINSKESSATLSLKLPFNNEFAARYLGGVPPEPDEVTIYRLHRSDVTEEVIKFWYGSVSAVKFSDTTATVTLLGIMSKLGVQIPVATYSWMCNHALYDARCGVNKSANTFTFRVNTISDDGVTLTLSDFGQANTKLADTGFFNGGIFSGPGSVGQRTVLSLEEPPSPYVPGSPDYLYTVVLLVPTSSLNIGDQVTVTAGCNHSIQVCHNRFTNANNYGGFPYIPTLNPFSTDTKR
jgi:uncharacterized phage protein (TIGR02218 family)